MPVETEHEKLVKMAEQDAREEGILGDDQPSDEQDQSGKTSDEQESGNKGEKETDQKSSDERAQDKEDEKAQDKEDDKASIIQKRIDEITAKRYEAERRAAAAEAKLEAMRSQPEKQEKQEEYTDEQLEQIANKYFHDPEHPEYAVQALRMLGKRDAKRESEAIEMKRKMQDRDQQLVASHQQTWQTLLDKYPLLKDKSSELFLIADEEYQRIPLRKRQEWPEEMETAVLRAQARLEGEKTKKKNAEAMKNSAKKGVVPLGGTTRSAAPSSAAQLEKLVQKAQETGDESDYLALMKAQAALQKKPKEE